MFDQTALNKAVNEAIASANVPAEHRNMVIATVDQKGAEFVVGLQRQHFGATWQVQGLYRHDWTTGEDSMGARVLTSW